MPAHVAHHHGDSAHAPAAHTLLFHHVLEDLAPFPSPSHQHHSPHNMPICSTSNNYHQPTFTSPPCILLAPTSPMPYTEYHHHNSLTLPCIQLLLPNIKIRLCPPQPSSVMALGHHVEEGASTCCPHHAHHSESNRETKLVPLKEQLGASLDRHEEPLVSWENIEPSDWPDVVQALQFLMPSSATRKAPNNVFSLCMWEWIIILNLWY